jgi:hypothetical protein
MRLHQQFLAQLHRLGRTDHWMKHSMMGGGETHTRIIDGYKVEITNDAEATKFIIKSDRIHCIEMSLYKDDNTASFLTAMYDAGCTIDGNMVRGEGTRKMIQIGLNLLKEFGATNVSMTDTSNIPCEGKNIRLGEMYFLKYGMTWYEKYFGFKPAERHRAFYEEAKKMRKKHLDIANLKELPCSYFTDEFVHRQFARIGFTHFQLIEWTKPLV